jgi:hypothetical protein
LNLPASGTRRPDDQTGSGDRHRQPATHLANPRAGLFGVHLGYRAKQGQTNPRDLDVEMITRFRSPQLKIINNLIIDHHRVDYEHAHIPCGRGRTSRTTETKSGVKTTETSPPSTTELIVFVLSVLGVLIAAAVTDNGDDGQGFGARCAWLYVTLLSIGYMISRGLAKAGSHRR